MEDRPLVLGVDGGQSSSLTVLADLDGTIRGAGLSGPVNHLNEPGALARQERSLREGYQKAFAAAGLPARPVTCAYLGLTGSGSMEAATRAVPAEQLVLKGDTVTALSGAIPGMVGVVVIAGTGSIAYGRNREGRTHRAGGWGYFAGDEGSGYDIARLGCRAIYQASDGRGPQTALSGAILEHFGCVDLEALHTAIYGGALGRDRLASAAGVVGRVAAAGDQVARRLLAEAGAELGRGAVAVLAALGLDKEAVPVSPVGGVFVAGDLVTGPMLAHIQAEAPDAVLQPPRFPPAIGAVLLALRELGVDPDEPILANLARTKDRIETLKG